MTGWIESALPRSGLLRFSILLHMAAVVALVWSPASWPLVLGVLVSDHLFICYCSLSPRNPWVGPNLTRIPEPLREGDQVALTFDDGPDPEVTPRILELLARYRATATFFLVGEKAERHPEIVRAIVDAGHRVENHSYRHSKWFCLLGPGRLGAELDRAQQVLTRHAGYAPRLFRAPGGLRNPWLDMVLVSRGLELVSWTRRGFDTVSGDGDKVFERLVRDLAPGDVLVLHDGGSARDANADPVVLSVLPQLLEHLKARGFEAVSLRAPQTHSTRRRPFGVVSKEIYYRLRTEGDSPGRKALSIGFGVALGCIPLWGIHLGACAVLGRVLGLNRIIAYLATHVSNPFTLPLQLYLGFGIGSWLFTGKWPNLTVEEIESMTVWTLGRDLLVGSAVMGLLLGAFSAGVSYAIGLRSARSAPYKQLWQEIARRYLPAGIFHWEFVRGKLQGDPMYRGLLECGALPSGGTVSDLGCGRGIASALLCTARELHGSGDWSVDWPSPAGELTLYGVDSRRDHVQVARTALGANARIDQGDVRDYSLRKSDVILVLDVLLYLSPDEQVALIRRVCRALRPGGVVILREADALLGLRFQITRAAERVCAILRGHWRQRYHYRSIREWCDMLESHGLETDIRPSWQGTPFGNVLVVARKPLRTLRPADACVDATASDLQTPAHG